MSEYPTIAQLLASGSRDRITAEATLKNIERDVYSYTQLTWSNKKSPNWQYLINVILDQYHSEALQTILPDAWRGVNAKQYTTQRICIHMTWYVPANASIGKISDGVLTNMCFKHPKMVFLN